MNKLFSSLPFLMLAFVLLVTSCSKDDADGGSLDTPKYESVSAKYEILSDHSPYKSIELGASGDYIVITSDYYSAMSRSFSLSKKGVFGNWGVPQSRATNYDGVIYGSYKQLSNGDFDLEGFGIIKVVYGDNDNVEALSITPDEGEEMQFDVEKVEVMDDDGLTNSLCRTWLFEKIRVVAYLDGKKVLDEYVDNGDLEYFDVEISEVLFSKSGTYMVIYGDETLGVASWKWKDMDDKMLYYSWDGEWYDDCTVQISFEGSSLVFYEETDDFGEFEEFDKIEMYTYLKEK